MLVALPWIVTHVMDIVAHWVSVGYFFVMTIPLPHVQKHELWSAYGKCSDISMDDFYTA